MSVTSLNFMFVLAIMDIAKRGLPEIGIIVLHSILNSHYSTLARVDTTTSIE